MLPLSNANQSLLDQTSSNMMLSLMTTVFLGDMITIMVSNDGSDDGGAGRDE